LSAVLPKVATIALVAGAIIAPWTIRNYVAFDRFILTSSNGGFNFYRGNNPGTTGSAWTPDGKVFWGSDAQWQQAEASMASGGTFEKAVSTIFYNDAVDWIRAHPADALILALKKGAILWTIDRMSPMAGRTAYEILSLALLAMFLVGVVTLWRARGTANGIGVIYCWAAAATLVAMIFFPMPRLQVIMIAGYFPIVAFGADAIAAVVRRKPQLL
jgi:hypothetical protein